jgi:SAM-dependent methyltransferase
MYRKQGQAIATAVQRAVRSARRRAARLGWQRNGADESAAAPQLPEEPVDWDTLRSAVAAKYHVSPIVHPEDLIWQFIAGHPNCPKPADVTNYYFSDGAESARKLADAVHRHLPRESLSLMEFASGYGMVTRHLSSVLPHAAITSCDIHPEALEFIRGQLGVSVVMSHRLPEDLHFAQPYDVVFALSFFSHLPELTFGRWLAALYRNVKPNGLLIFTTHGLVSRRDLGNPEIPASGIWFKPESEQHDIEGAEYGSSITTPEYVIRALSHCPAAQLLEHRVGYWWLHQDLYIALKPDESSATWPGSAPDLTPA